MKYKLRNTYTQDPIQALPQILQDRGVVDIENFMKPSRQCELDPYKLKNVKEGADLLLSHLRNMGRLLRTSHNIFLL